MPCLDVLLNSKPQLSFVCTIAENSASNDKSGSVAGRRPCKKKKSIQVESLGNNSITFNNHVC